MSIIDTHTHLYLKHFDLDRDLVIKRALDIGINKFYLPCININYLKRIINLKNKYPKFFYPMIGLHPTSVKIDNYKKELKIIENLIDCYEFSAVGEIGIDNIINRNLLEEQKKAFYKQVVLSKKKSLPIVIHSRNSFKEVFKILNSISNNYNGILHCFSGTLDDAKTIINFGLKIGIGGLITFKNVKICDFLHEIKIENIVLETDSPFLAPVPFRGKRNEPSYLKIIIKKLSKIYSISEKEIAEITTNNALLVFNK